MQYFVGPLNINRRTQQADTVMGMILPLDAQGFAALDMLAARAGHAVPFATLTQAWDSQEEARRGLAFLLQTVTEAGHGFMWITHTPTEGYTLCTRWGRNFRTQAA